jgi:hypothetical protein
MPVLPLPAAPLVPPVALSPVPIGPDAGALDVGLPGVAGGVTLELGDAADPESASLRPHAVTDKASATLKAINVGFIIRSFLSVVEISFDFLKQNRHLQNFAKRMPRPDQLFWWTPPQHAAPQAQVWSIMRSRAEAQARQK